LESSVLRGFALGVEEIHQIFNLVRLESISEGRHGSPAVVDLMLDLLFLQVLTDGAQIRAKLTASAIYAVTMLTPLLVKDGSSRSFAITGIRVNNRWGRLRRTTHQSGGKDRETSGDEDSQGAFGVSSQRS
jgi:hypothetical protein